jgi:hypothetical protein
MRLAPRWNFSKTTGGALTGCAALVLSLAAVRICERRRLKGPRIVRKVEDG